MITRLETTNFTIKNTIKSSLRFSPVFPVFTRQIVRYFPHKNRKISLKETSNFTQIKFKQVLKSD